MYSGIILVLYWYLYEYTGTVLRSNSVAHPGLFCGAPYSVAHGYTGAPQNSYSVAHQARCATE